MCASGSCWRSRCVRLSPSRHTHVTLSPRVHRDRARVKPQPFEHHLVRARAGGRPSRCSPPPGRAGSPPRRRRPTRSPQAARAPRVSSSCRISALLDSVLSLALSLCGACRHPRLRHPCRSRSVDLAPAWREHVPRRAEAVDALPSGFTRLRVAHVVVQRMALVRELLGSVRTRDRAEVRDTALPSAFGSPLVVTGGHTCAHAPEQVEAGPVSAANRYTVSRFGPAARTVPRLVCTVVTAVPVPLRRWSSTWWRPPSVTRTWPPGSRSLRFCSSSSRSPRRRARRLRGWLLQTWTGVAP